MKYIRDVLVQTPKLTKKLYQPFDKALKKSRRAAYMAIVAIFSVVSVFGFTPMALAAPLPPAVTIDSATPNPTNSGVSVVWHASTSGDYRVRVNQASCGSFGSSSVDSGTYTTPTSKTTNIGSGSLINGNNTILVCVGYGPFWDYEWVQASTTVIKDVAKPTVSAFTATSPTNNLNIPITSFTATDTGGAGVSAYMITSNPTVPAAGDPSWTVAAPSSYTVAASGTYTLYPWAKDAAGNVSNVFGSPRTVLVDAIAPTVTSFAVTSPTNTLNVPVNSFTANDVGLAGLSGYMITINGVAPSAGDAGWSATAQTSFTVPASGTYTLYPWAKDAYGNVSSVYALPPTVVADTIAPTVVIDSVPTVPTNQSIDVTWHADENGTYGVRVGGTDCTNGTWFTSGTYASQPGTITTNIPTSALSEGNNTIRVCVSDQVLNTGYAVATVVYDTTSPVVTIDDTDPNPTNGGSDLTWHATEAGTYSVRVGGHSCHSAMEVASGSYTSGSVTTSIGSDYLEVGMNDVWVCFMDLATNKGKVSTHVAKDVVAPVITLVGDNPMTIMLNSWFNDPGANVTDNFDHDGYIYGDSSAVDTSAIGSYTVTYDATDEAGNNAAQVTRTVIVDDMDGVSASVENAGPNGGDANNDGILDSEQADVTSLVDPVTGKYAVLENNRRCANQGVLITPESGNVVQDLLYDYPAGLMHFTLDCNQQNEDREFSTGPVTVTQYYYGVSGSFVARKYDPVTRTYKTIPDAVISHVTIDGQSVTKVVYQITDGGELDQDGEKNGIIVDPVGLATEVPKVVVTTTTTTTTTNTKAPNTGFEQKVAQKVNVVNILAATFLVSLFATALYATRRQLVQEEQ